MEFDKKKAAFLGISALGSLIVSYLVYRRVTDQDEETKKQAAYERKLQRKRERFLRRQGMSPSPTKQGRAYDSSNPNSSSKIVGANQQFQQR